MTLAERLLKVFNGERPDCIPWFADLTYWYHASLRRGTLPERYKGDGVVDLYRDLGCGCHEAALCSPWVTEYEDVQVQRHEEKDASGEPVRQETVWQTPVGDLTSIQSYEPASYCWAYRKYPVENAADLRTLRFVYEHMHVRPDYSEQHRQLALWQDIGVPSSLPPRSPFANLVAIWMGVLNVSYALSDALPELEQTMEVMGVAEDPIYEIIAGSPAPLVYFGENITGEVVSPRLFERYYAPYYRRRAATLHAAGKRIFVHIDGTFRCILPLVAASGVDCAQSLTVAPVGDVEVGEMRALAGPDLILWSGVPGALFSPLYPAEMVAEIVMACIAHHKEQGRFIMGVCDQVPPDGEIERVRLVTDLVEKHGRYDL